MPTSVTSNNDMVIYLHDVGVGGGHLLGDKLGVDGDVDVSLLLELLQEGGVNLHGLGEDVATRASLDACQLHALRQGARQVKLDALHQVLQDLNTHSDKAYNNRLFMVPHRIRAQSAYKDIRIHTFYHTHTHTHTVTRLTSNRLAHILTGICLRKLSL